MSHLLELHKEKKHFLEKFTSLNSRELLNFAEGNYEGLDSFYHKREKILEILQMIEEKINQTINLPATVHLNAVERKMLESSLDAIRRLTQTIVQQDMDILSLIEATKSAIIKELQSVKKNKKSFSSYKTKVDHHQIDEEA